MEAAGNNTVIQFYKAPASTTRSDIAVSIADVYRYITGTRAFSSTNTLRAMEDARQRREYKCKAFDFVTFSGLFTTRRDSDLLRHSGLMCMDFDHLGDDLPRVRELLINDRLLTTELLFTSPSGDGLKWVIRTDISIAEHKTWFTGVCNYLLSTYNLEADRSGANVSRACFLPYDPHCYINPEVHLSE